jgi:integrase
MSTIERRKDSRGELTYRAKVRLLGHPAASRTFTKLAPAKAWAAAVETAMRNGEYATGSGRTVTEAIDHYWSSKLGALRDQRMRRAHLAWWRDVLRHIRLRDLTAVHIARQLDGLAAQQIRLKEGQAHFRAGATVNRYRAALSAMLTHAEAQNPPWIAGNPARRTEHRAESRGRTRFLTPTERRALLDEARRSRSADLYLAVVLSLASGGGQSEVLGLRWMRVDLDRGALIFAETKNGDSRRVPLLPETVELLRKRRSNAQPHTNLVFPSPNNPELPVDLRASFRAACRRAGVQGFCWHDLRHSAASALADSGASLLDIGTVLGHRSQQTTRRYAHLTENRLGDLITRAANKHQVL